jgi:hypothetical protein
VLTLLIALASAVVSTYALKYTIDTQTYPDVKTLETTGWHCTGGCAVTEQDSITIDQRGAPILLLNNGMGGPSNLSNAVYDRGTGIIETLAGDPATVSVTGWKLRGKVSRDGNLIVWWRQGTETNNGTAWWR